MPSTTASCRLSQGDVTVLKGIVTAQQRLDGQQHIGNG
jgi:hypothetical protein